MGFITLTQQCSVWQPENSITGGREKTVREPVYINPDHIESLFFAGVTIVKMVSGERFNVYETPDAIIQAAAGPRVKEK
ncbi:flagellar FlbD family protein [Atlantibacter hermannii]|uniref:flagellar FlbD family protein n=1 Tax=Atlantibacter hermannii TaxID=565 RepID=UPI0028A7DAF1|nr:flagellar FlbD family protein [Atlantibacter hermannii]